MQVQEAERSGSLVIEAKGVGFGYGDRPVIRDLTTTIMRGDKVGIIGPNGSGKTTLLRLLLGESAAARGDGPARDEPGGRLLRPVEGHARRGEDGPAERQRRTTRSRSTASPGTSWATSRTSSSRPSGRGAWSSSSPAASGAGCCWPSCSPKPSNVLVLDEPTNDLDVETLELLESLLVDYQGTVLLVSHDRAFLNDVVTEHPGDRGRRPGQGVRRRLRRLPPPAAGGGPGRAEARAAAAGDAGRRRRSGPAS